MGVGVGRVHAWRRREIREQNEWLDRHTEVFARCFPYLE